MKKEITLGEKIFEFPTFNNWCNTAQRKFSSFFGHALTMTVCIDQKGRICTSGKQFMRARDDNSFPIEVFLIE